MRDQPATGRFVFASDKTSFAAVQPEDMPKAYFKIFFSGLTNSGYLR